MKPRHLFTGGLQLQGDLDIEHAPHSPWRLADAARSSCPTGRGTSGLFASPQGCAATAADGRDFGEVKRHLPKSGWPAGWPVGLQPHGTFATFDGAHRWIAGSIPDGCVLIGDAAGASDTGVGQWSLARRCEMCGFCAIGWWKHLTAFGGDTIHRDLTTSFFGCDALSASMRNSTSPSVMTRLVVGNVRTT